MAVSVSMRDAYKSRAEEWASLADEAETFAKELRARHEMAVPSVS
jgi:hypothetical protein